jgi:hypothetical protein
LGLSVARAQRPAAEARDPFAAPAAKASERAARPRAASAADRIEDELRRTSEIDVVEMPLKDCVLYLQERHGIPIVLNVKKLDEAGVSADSPVTTSLRGITLRSILNIVLGNLELAHVVKDEVLQITTAADARSILEVRVYDCRDLLGQNKPKRDGAATATDPEAVPMPGLPGTFGGGRGRVSGEEMRVQRLLALIAANVDSDSWQGAAAPEDAENSGQVSGAVSEYEGLVVVTQTARTHEKIERLLNLLREASGMEQRTGRVLR